MESNKQIEIEKKVSMSNVLTENKDEALNEGQDIEENSENSTEDSNNES